MISTQPHDNVTNSRGFVKKWKKKITVYRFVQSVLKSDHTKKQVTVDIRYLEHPLPRTFIYLEFFYYVQLFSRSLKCFSKFSFH